MYIQTNFKHPKQIYKKNEQFENKIKKQNIFLIKPSSY